MLARTLTVLNCSCARDENDPDRYLPAGIAQDKLTLVGFMLGRSVRCEVDLDANATAGIVAKEVDSV